MRLRLVLIPLFYCAALACSGFQAGPGPEPAFFNALCDHFQEDPYFESTAPIFVIHQTAPLMKMLALVQVYTEPINISAIEDASRREAAIRDNFKPVEIQLSNSLTQCNWVKTTERPALHGKDLVLEIGPVIENPYADHSGRFARRSLGGIPGASWFWIEIHDIHNNQSMYNIVPLEISDG